MATPVVAIVGRPNVGKSELFNRLIGQKKSIVDSKSGVTRDRSYGYCQWTNKTFKLIDTGGLDIDNQDELSRLMKKQSLFAIQEADLIILAVDVKIGVTIADKEVAQLLIKSGKEVIVAVNKCDSLGGDPLEMYEFYNLGFETIYPVSAIHGHGLGDMLDEIISIIEIEETSEDVDQIKIAIIGKPNVGKSSLINRLIKEDRMIVSDIAGTTRDAVDTIIKKDDREYLFIDTAGIRRKSKIIEDVERYSIIRAQMAIDRADICIMIIDAVEGFSQQDSKIVGYAHDKGKGSIIAVNKWDLIEKNSKTINEYENNLRKNLSFIQYAPIIYISAKTGKRVESLYGVIDDIYEQYIKRISTGRLNEMLSYATARVQPPSDRGKRLKIYYITQSRVAPPTFIVFVNEKELFHFSYKRYIENQIRSEFGFEGTPIIIITREKNKG